MNANQLRTSHPSSAQVESLIEYIEKNPGLAKGFVKTKKAKERSRRQWDEVSVRLNNMGGTFKSSKQWTKYWSDKKSAIKRKVAARSAARSRSGGQEDDEVELTDVEERVVALCGGESFAKGDAHSASHSGITTQAFPINDVPQQLTAKEEPHAIEIFIDAGEDHMSPPPIRLSDTPTPPPSGCGGTEMTSSVFRRRTSPSSCTTSRHASHATSIASPARGTSPRTNMDRSSQASRHRSSVVTPPPSRRRMGFASITERFLRLEEQRLEIERSNSQLLRTYLEGSAESNRVIAEASRVIAEALAAVLARSPLNHSFNSD